MAAADFAVAGLAVTGAALIVMPVLAVAKRRTGQVLGNRTLPALAHDHGSLVTSGTFSFITGGLTAALDRAKAAAGGGNVLAHTPDIAQQLLRAGLLDEIQLHLVPILLGAGRRLFENTGQASGELQQIKAIETPNVTHLYYRVTR